MLETDELDLLAHGMKNDVIEIREMIQSSFDLVQENKDLIAENERLREALEGLLHIEAVTQPSDYEELLKNVRGYVVEALEQPE